MDNSEYTELTVEERLKKERTKRMKLQSKLKSEKRRADILTAVTVILVLAIAVSVIMTISKKLEPAAEDTQSRLSKDSALAVMLTSPLLSVRIDSKDIQIKSMSDMFSLLRTGGWTVTSDKPSGTAKVVFTVEPGYTLSLFDSRYVQIADGASVRTYKTDAAIADDITTFIYDNTTLTAEDLSSLISQTKEVFFNSEYYSNYLSAGTGLSAALDPVSWTQIDFYPAGSDPSTTITAWDNVTVSLYDTDMVSVVIFNGNAVYYRLPETVLTDVRTYISRILSNEIKTVIDNLRTYPELNLNTPDSSYTVIPEDTFISLLRTGDWQRLLETPQLPASPSYNLTDGETVSLRLYREKLIAEINGGEQFYTVPAEIFTNLASYIADATSPSVPAIPDEEKDKTIEGIIQLLSSAADAQSRLTVSLPDKTVVVKATAALTSLLSVQSWQKTENPDSLNPEKARSITVVLSENMSLRFFTDDKVCYILDGSDSPAVYAVPPTLTDDITVYAAANAFEDTVTLSAAALAELLKAQTALQTAVYDGVTTRLAAGDAQFANDLSSWISSLSLKALEQKPTVSADKKTVLTFSGEQTVSVTFSNLSDGTAALNVSSKNESDGTVINNWFTVQNQNYVILSGQVSAYMYAMQDKLAADFALAFKNGDNKKLLECMLLSDMEEWGYDRFFSARLSDAAVTPAESGKYKLTVNVTDPVVSGMKDGENTFIMTVDYDQTAGRMCISSLVSAETAALSASAQNDEVQTVIRFISRCTDAQFSSPADIDKTSLINFCMLLIRKYGDGSRTSFTQADINAAAEKYFGLETLSDTTSPLFNAETGLYTISSAAAVTPSLTLTGLETDGDICRVTVARTSDPLKLFATSPITYTLRKVTETVTTGADGEKTESEVTYFMYISAVNAEE